MADIENVEKLPRSSASFWERVGSAFENGYGNEGRLATLTAHAITAVVAVVLSIIGLVFLPFIAIGNASKKLIETGKNGQRMVVNIMHKKLGKNKK